MSGYTKEQEVIVKRILSNKGNFYKVLSVEKTSTDGEIKKAYRKLALKIHPDKNNHPNAPEAFKAVSKAFEILSNEDQKRIYDQTGQDPSSRGAQAAASGFSGFSGFDGATRSRASGGRAQEFHFTGNGFDEDIFNIFFGGGGTPGMHSFTFGPGGFQTFGGPTFQTRRTRTGATAGSGNQQTNGRESLVSNLTQLLPIIILLLFSLITSYFNGSEANVPQYSFTQQKPYEHERNTPNFGVKYYITREKFEDSKIKDLNKLDKSVEGQYIQNLNFKCTLERNEKQQILADAQGFFYNDEELIMKGNNYPMPSCDRLKSLGLI
ncbi:type I HSP40 co-chaperone [Saccharomycopsis crataegensis]|uniref:Type I HSP40 co-chaperone n=1 Tax=Saccharomycopsis crataegensis TaxID=43959 RepID=A0AAV5QLI5_9ASCO|nr:type I HSP40 co-chaperone [Saccharomycopsis crataegensis]